MVVGTGAVMEQSGTMGRYSVLKEGMDLYGQAFHACACVCSCFPSKHHQVGSRA